MSKLHAVAARLHTAWIFPIVVGVLFAVLVASGLNGSSIGALTSDPAGGADLVAGNPRHIRSDEFYVRTPIVIGQAERGFPSEVESGIGEHDVTVLLDLPTRNWAMIFRPHEWAYGVLPLEQAFAFDWWGLSAVLLLGTYSFLLVLTRRPLWSSIGAVVFWASPFFAWWYLALSLGVAGYGLGGAGLLLASFLPRWSPRVRWCLVGAAAYVLTCFALTFYPPFQVPLAIVVAAVSIGWTWQQVAGGELAWRPIAVNAAVAGGITAVVSALFLVTRVDTLSAIMHTTYPGDRRVDGGDAPSGFIASSWFGLKYVQNPESMRDRVLSNESEGSSFLMIGLFLLPAIPLLWSRIAAPGARLRGALIGTLVGTSVVAVHMYLGLPGLVAKVTLLDRVPAMRAVIGLGIGSLLIAVLLGVQIHDAAGALSLPRRLGAAAITAVVAVGYILTLASQYLHSGAPVGRKDQLIAVVAVVAVVGLFFWRPLLGLSALAVCGLAVSLTVNPLTRGLGTITDAPLTRAVETIASSSKAPPAWLNTIDMSMPALSAAGVDDVSAVNIYPDHTAWAELDPDGSDQPIWNRYAHTRWVLDPTASAPVFALLSNDTVSITIDPCGKQLDELHVGHVVVPAPVDAACLRRVATTEALDGSPAYIYERVASGTS